MDLKHIVEALIFAAPEPITTSEIMKAVRRGAEKNASSGGVDFSSVTEQQVLEAIERLEAGMEAADRPIRLQQSPAGWRLVTRPEMAEWIRALLPEMRPEKLSAAALETLALIAYRQPITKADIEAVRGVNCDGMIAKLMERGLVDSAGRADLPGRPLLYATTSQFLEHFGIPGIDSLPNVDELRKVNLPKAEPVPQPEPPKDKPAKRPPTEIELAEAALDDEDEKS